jgi:WD40 repeat protein
MSNQENQNKQSTFRGDVGSVDNQGHIGSSGNHNIIESAVGEVKGNNFQASGDATITITNYYYREAVKLSSVESEETLDSSLPCPYRGLYHFGPNDAEVFFGRDVFIEELYRATKTRNFIPVLGASGSGKSSVVLAGLVPKLEKEGHWKFTHFRPGAEPFQALASALVPLYTPNLDETDQIVQTRKLASYLRDTTIPLSDVIAKIQQNHLNHRILLIADQFEELYTLCKEEEIRRRFLDCLLICLGNTTNSSTSALVLVTTMRVDFLANALAYPEFADRLRESDIKIRSMNHQELVSVIEKPVQRLGVTFETGLVQRILEDVEDQPGNLPLLEFALTELWNKRTGQQLTHHVYEHIGQVKGALARHADEKYGNLTEAEKEKVRRIFIQLVRPGEGTEDTRRVAIKGELGEQNWSLVKQLADARLVVTSRDASQQETVEVVHEALIQNWGELQAWMNTDRVFRAWQERLRGAKKQWEATNKDSGSLLRGAALAEAEERLSERPEDLIYEAEFIQGSIQEQKRLQQEKEARRRRDIRTAWGVALGSLIAVAISTGLWFTARYRQKQSELSKKEAEISKKQAELSEADSLGRYSLSLSNQGKDLDASIAAIQAAKILQKYKADDPEVMGALITNIYEGRERNRLEDHDAGISSVSFSPDGKTLVSGSADNTIKLWDVQTGKEITTLRGHDYSVTSVSFSPNGKTLTSSSLDNTIKLWDIQTGKEITTFRGHSDFLWSVSFSPDGKTLASSSLGKTIKLWNVQTQKEITTLRGHDKSVFSVSFSRDGKTLVSGSADNTIKLWDVQTQKEIATLQGHDSHVNSVSFSRDGKILASGSWDNTIKLWDVQTHKEITTLQGHDDSVSSVSFSPDGKTLASGSRDKTIRLWDVQTGQEITTLQGHDDSVSSVSFSPDGKTLVSGSADNTIKLWDVQTPKEITTLQGHNDRVFSVSFSPDGKTLASGSLDNTIRLWDVQTSKEITTLHGHDDRVFSVSFSPDGKTLASGSDDKTIKLWDIQTGQEITTLQGHDDRVFSVSFSRDGKTLASGSQNTIRLWDVQTHKGIATLQGHNSSVDSVSFSPDGKTLAVGSQNTIRLWDVQIGKEIATLQGHDSHVNSVNFSPDGKTLASGSEDKTITLWDVQTAKEIATLKGHDDEVNSVSFSPDGKTLASSSRDKTITVWDVQTGKEITTLQGHDDEVNSVSFSPDGQTLASGSRDDTIKLWNLDFDYLMERSCDRIRNYLLYNPNVEDRDLCDGIGTEQ